MQRSESRSGIHSKGLIITSPDDEGCLYKGGEENRSRGIFQKCRGELLQRRINAKGSDARETFICKFPSSERK